MKSKYLNALFLIFIVALPFSWASVGSMSIYRIVTLFVFAVWITLKNLKIPIPVDERKKYFFAWVAYVGYAICAIILYPSNTNVFFGMILLFMISLIFFSTKIDYEAAKYIDDMWLAAAIFFVLLFLSGGSGQVGEWGARKSLVILGTPTDANEFSSFFIVALPIALYQFLNEKGLIKKVVCAVILVAGLYIVLMAGSRAALLSLIIALVITVCMVNRPSPKTILFLFVIGGLSLILLPRYILPLIPQETVARLSLEALRSDQGSGRMQIWTTALQAFWDRNPVNWILGCGYGGLEISYYVGDTSTMHNQYLQQLVSYGLIGLILYLRLVVLAYKQLKKNNCKYIGPFVGIMIMAMTLSMGPSYKIIWILFFMAGIVTEKRGSE